MDKLRIILQTLSEQDHQDLQQFIQRQKPSESRKDLELLQLLLEEEGHSSEEMTALLYPENPNQVAYHALRKRLIKQVSDFIFLKRREVEPTSSSQIMSLITLASHLFDHHAPRLAWETIRKAEKLASNHEQFDLLHAIYNIQIEQAGTEFAPELESILEKRALNRQRADEDERARIAYRIISQQLSEARQHGQPLDFEMRIQQILETYQLTEAVHSHPRLLYHLMFITRSAVVAKKDYLSFEPYVIGMYQQMKAEHGFAKAHHEYQIQLLYMIAHVLYRNKKFEESVAYLTKMEAALLAHQKSHFAKFYPRYAMLMAANFSFLNRLTESVELLEELLNGESYRLSTKDALNARLSLCVAYYQLGKYSAVIQTSLGFSHSDKWMEKKMGREWVVKRMLSEIMFQIDLGHFDLACNRLRSLERSYRSFFQRIEYSRAATYLDFLKRMIRHPEKVITPSFYQKIRSAFHFNSMEAEDPQEVTFYAWLKAKVTAQPYLEVLQDLIHRKGEPELVSG